MKNQSQNNNTTGQSSVIVRKSQKHEVNLQKNSTLYFQIGLILCLLGTFALFEMQFESNKLVLPNQDIDDESVEYAMTDVKVYKPEVQEIKTKLKKFKVIDVIDVIDNDTPEPDPTELITTDVPAPTKGPLNPNDVVPVIEQPEEDFNIKTVEFVPIFPGCEKYELNSERSKCLNEKLGKLVRKKFNTDIAIDHGLYGVQKIDVQFKVDKTGNITEIRTRAPHPKLDAEALRIANKIPKMKPGKMGTTPVNVTYNLPITFKVQD